MEALARFASPPLSPPEYLEAEPDDERFHCCVGPHPYLPGHPPATRFDPRLIWTLDPRVPGQALPLPSRSEIISERTPRERVVVALGDGFTAGPLAPRLAWPAFLQELVDINRPPSGLRVVNAAVPGYSSLQGLLSYRQMEDLRADVVVLAFGADDARTVRRDDSRWLERIRQAEAGDRSRALATLLRWAWALRPASPATHRVPLDEYAAHLRDLVRLARARGAEPVLLTRPYRGGQPLPEALASLPRYNAAARAAADATGARCLDLEAELAGSPGLFADAIRPSPLGLRRAAETVLRHLRERRLVETDHRLASGGRVADWSDLRPELVSGFWPAETWPDGRRGRWTGARAEIRLGRPPGHDLLVLDLSLESPLGRTEGYVEVDGRRLARFEGSNGPRQIRVDLRGLAPRGEVHLTLAVRRPFRPRREAPDSSDDRELGVFVHEARLLPG